MGAGIGGGTLLGVLSAYTIIELARVEKHCVLDAPLLKRMTYPQVSYCLLPNPCDIVLLFLLLLLLLLLMMMMMTYIGRRGGVSIQVPRHQHMLANCVLEHYSDLYRCVHGLRHLHLRNPTRCRHWND